MINNKVDDIIEDLNGFGKYQKIRYILICLSGLFPPIASYMHSFIAASPPYRLVVVFFFFLLFIVYPAIGIGKLSIFDLSFYIYLFVPFLILILNIYFVFCLGDYNVNMGYIRQGSYNRSLINDY